MPSASQARLVIALSLPLLNNMEVALTLLQVWFYDEDCFLDDPGRSSFLPGAVRSRFVGCVLKPRTAEGLTLPLREAVAGRVCISAPFGFRECSYVLPCDSELQNL
jgi:hypothetical protein